jgi:hypothetical protein
MYRKGGTLPLSLPARSPEGKKGRGQAKGGERRGREEPSSVWPEILVVKFEYVVVEFSLETGFIFVSHGPSSHD